MVAIAPLGTHSIHHASVTHTHKIVPHTGTNSLAGDFLDIGHKATIGSLIGECIAQCCTNGVSGEMLHMSGKMQQVALIAALGMNSGHGKLPMSERSSLIEDHGIHLRKRVNIIRTFY